MRVELTFNPWLVNALLEPVDGPDHWTAIDSWLHGVFVLPAGQLGGDFNTV